MVMMTMMNIEEEVIPQKADDNHNGHEDGD